MAQSLAEVRLHQEGPILAQWARDYEFEGRAYKDPETGETYPSVTSVLKNTPKADMMRWAARVVAERARDRPDIVLGDPDKVVDRLQYAPTDYRDERGWVGSGVHKAIEAHMSDIWYEDPEFTSEQEMMMLSFEEFLTDYTVTPILTETTVLIDCGEAGSVMGTLDGLWNVKHNVTGVQKTSLVDIKTSKGLWPEHNYQLSALRKATHWFEQVPEGTPGALLHKHPKLGKTWWLKHEFDFEIDETRILHIRDEGYQFKQVEHLDLNFDTYCTYLRLWHNLKAIDAAERAKYAW